MLEMYTWGNEKPFQPCCKEIKGELRRAEWSSARQNRLGCEVPEARSCKGLSGKDSGTMGSPPIQAGGGRNGLRDSGVFCGERLETNMSFVASFLSK